MAANDKIVTYKDIEHEFGVKRSKAINMATNTRKAYSKKEREPITLAQVKKANNLNE